MFANRRVDKRPMDSRNLDLPVSSNMAKTAVNLSNLSSSSDGLLSIENLDDQVDEAVSKLVNATNISIKNTSWVIAKLVYESETVFFAAIDRIMSNSRLSMSDFMMKYWLPFGNILWRPTNFGINLSYYNERKELQDTLHQLISSKKTSLKYFLESLEQHMKIFWVFMDNDCFCGDLYIIISSFVSLLRRGRNLFLGSNLTIIYSSLTAFLLHRLLIPSPKMKKTEKEVLKSESFVSSFILVHLLTRFSKEFDLYWKTTGSKDVITAFICAWKHENSFWPNDDMAAYSPPDEKIFELLTDSSKIVDSELSDYLNFFFGTWTRVQATRVIQSEDLEQIVFNHFKKFTWMQLFSFLSESNPDSSFPFQLIDSCGEFQEAGHLEVVNLSLDPKSKIREIAKFVFQETTGEQWRAAFREIKQGNFYQSRNSCPPLCMELLHLMFSRKLPKTSLKIYWLYCVFIST